MGNIKPDKKKLPINPLYIIWGILWITMVFRASLFRGSTAQPTPITYSQFLDLAENGTLSAVQMDTVQIQAAL